jgi:hypothetical protein
VTIVTAIPGTEVPGYFHGVPLGRENSLSLLSLSVSATDDETS